MEELPVYWAVEFLILMPANYSLLPHKIRFQLLQHLPLLAQVADDISLF